MLEKAQEPLKSMRLDISNVNYPIEGNDTESSDRLAWERCKYYEKLLFSLEKPYVGNKLADKSSDMSDNED